MNKVWYVASKSINIHNQGLVADENTGENIAVIYKGENAPLVAAAPELLEALQASNEFIRRMVSEGFIHPSDMQEVGEIQANNYTAIIKANKRWGVCVHCGIDFDKNNSDARDTNTFCDSSCEHEHQQEGQFGKSDTESP